MSGAGTTGILAGSIDVPEDLKENIPETGKGLYLSLRVNRAAFMS